MSTQLQVLIKPCSSGTCPAIYKDEQGRLYLQGSKLAPSGREGVEVADHEEVVEIDSSLLDFLRSV